jgi:hypothetical protein
LIGVGLDLERVYCLSLDQGLDRRALGGWGLRERGDGREGGEQGGCQGAVGEAFHWDDCSF